MSEGLTIRRTTGRIDSLKQMYMPSRVAWRRWLAKHHLASPGIWLVYDKKNDRDRPLPYNVIVEEALAFGWIDSRPRTLSLTQAMLLITPRKARSGWSGHNKERIAKLDADGRLAPAGRAIAEQARRDGREKLTAVEALSIPPDLAQALGINDAAAKNFASFPRSSKQIILLWILSAQRSATRRQILQRGELIHVHPDQCPKTTKRSNGPRGV